ncbi:MAG: hypothetical protein JSW41_02255 [Candidatus Aenigmatarchaeota archaeon]|nr:MAG: hypothetical protein JSW41_02255 [Candidatus Aenigmarchaeota archaeon]
MPGKTEVKEAKEKSGPAPTAKPEVKLLSKEDKAVKKLEEEKKGLEDKYKSLAKILELSAKQKPKKEPELPEEVSGGKIDKDLEYLKKSLKSMKKTIKLIDPEKKTEEMKNLVSKIEQQTKAIDKISAMDIKIKELEKKMTGKEEKKTEETGNIFGGFGMLGGKKSSEGASKDTKQLLDDFKEGMGERLLNLEKRVESIRVKIGDDRLKKIDFMISAKDDIENKMIPKRVKEEVEKILSVFSFGIENLSSAIKNLTTDIERSNNGMESVFNWIEATNERIKNIEQKLSSDEIPDPLDYMKKINEDVITMNEKIRYLEELLHDLQKDYRLVDILKYELKKAKPVKGERKRNIPKKIAENRFKQVVEVIEKVEKEKSNDKKMKALKDLEISYKKGLISKELYERILKKLKR